MKHTQIVGGAIIAWYVLSVLGIWAERKWREKIGSNIRSEGAIALTSAILVFGLTLILW